MAKFHIEWQATFEQVSDFDMDMKLANGSEDVFAASASEAVDMIYDKLDGENLISLDTAVKRLS